jgi:crotonobetaine/carnitine-CoA ligase
MRIDATGSECTGHALWRTRVATTPERTFLRYGGRTWTYAEFDDVVMRTAGGLVDLGVEQGSRVLLGLTNRPEAIALQFALQQLGAVSIPLVPGGTFDELAYLINHCRAPLLVADDPIASLVEPRTHELRHLEQIIAPDEVAAAPIGPPVLQGYDDRSLAYVLYTSGSTARPKGVMIPAGSFWSCGDLFAERYELTESDNYFLPLPLGHAIGALSAMSMTLHRGSSVTLVDRFSPSSFWEVTREHGATLSILFPAQLNLLLETDDGTPARGESTFRLISTHVYLDSFRDRFGIELALTWGMTETGAICTITEPGYRGELGEGYVGTCPRGVEVACFSDAGERLPPGESGEICLYHPHVMLGYLDDPAATAASLRNGWVRSGDRGVVRPDGHVFFHGRIKNVIKRSGENISAEEVEGALERLGDILECVVFAVPDPIRTEEVAAVVRGKPGAAVEPVMLRTVLGDVLARWKLPRYVDVREEPLPRLANGKLDRRAVEASFGPEAAWDAERLETT